MSRGLWPVGRLAGHSCWAHLPGTPALTSTSVRAAAHFQALSTALTDPHLTDPPLLHRRAQGPGAGAAGGPPHSVSGGEAQSGCSRERAQQGQSQWGEASES